MAKSWKKNRKSWEKWGKVGKVGKSGKRGEKLRKVAKSGEKLEKVGKSGPFQIHTDLNSFFKFWKITFDHSSCHFRSMSVIELVRDIWMNNACVKFEERSLNPSKVIALTMKL